MLMDTKPVGCAELDRLYQEPAQASLKDVPAMVQETLLAKDLLAVFIGANHRFLEPVPVQNAVGNTHYVYTLSKQNSECCPDALCNQLQKYARPLQSLVHDLLVLRASSIETATVGHVGIYQCI
jgi:hypothetical protein